MIRSGSVEEQMECYFARPLVHRGLPLPDDEVQGLGVRRPPPGTGMWNPQPLRDALICVLTSGCGPRPAMRR